MIFLEIIFGILFGFVLGLIPSFHINVLAYLFLIIGLFSFFSENFYLFFSFATSMTIAGIVPLLLFNISTPDNFTLNLGQSGSQDLSLYISGFIFGSFFSVLLLPLFYLLFILFSDFYILIFLFLLVTLVFLILQEKNAKARTLSFLIVFFSGLLGVLTLKYNFFFSEPLLPCIFGLFALPGLLLGNKEEKARPKSVQEIVHFRSRVFDSFLGSLFSSLIAIVPSLSPGIAISLPSLLNTKGQKEKRVLLSSTLISVILIYFFMALVFKKSRIGFVSILLEQGIIPVFSFLDILLMVFVFLFVVSLTCLLLLFFYSKISLFVFNLPKSKLLVFVILFSVALIVLVTNIYSLFLILLSFFIGVLPIVYNKNKLLLMSYLIVPTILFFI